MLRSTRLRSSCLASLLVLMSGPCLAGYVDGNLLMEGFQAIDRIHSGHSSNDDLGKAFNARAYVVGVADSVDSILVCWTQSNRMDADQLAAVVYKHLKEQPENWRKPAAWTVIGILSKLYPCPEAQADALRAKPKF